MDYDLSVRDPNHPLAAVRKRPEMYFGDVTDGTGLHELLYWCVRDCLERGTGKLARIEVTLTSTGSLRVADDGPGISLARGRDGRSFLQALLTDLPAPGPGLGPVCAVCSDLTVVVSNEAGQFRQRFARGNA